LVLQSFYSYVPDPFFPGNTIQVFDSSTVKLGRINPNTGSIAIISPYSVVAQAGFSLNAGSAIDPGSMTYYYSNGSHLVGISLITGLRTSYLPFSYEMGDIFNLMRNTENCYQALARRKRTTTSVEPEIQARVSVYPNPANDLLQISSSETIRRVEITSVDGKTLYSLAAEDVTRGLDLTGLAPGVYLVKVVLQNEQAVVRKWVKG
jgi:hypothetical protein